MKTTQTAAMMEGQAASTPSTPQPTLRRCGLLMGQPSEQRRELWERQSSEDMEAG